MLGGMKERDTREMQRRKELLKAKGMKHNPYKRDDGATYILGGWSFSAPKTVNIL